MNFIEEHLSKMHQEWSIQAKEKDKIDFYSSIMVN
jgi:hypothetical protein